MKSSINSDDVIAMFRAASIDIEAAEHELNEIDATLGDGDHGMSLALGFRAVRQRLDSVAEKDLGTILKSVGATLVSSMGGSAGPLYGTMFMRAGVAIGAKRERALSDLVAAAEAAANGVAERGQCQLGDKTILDAIGPAAQALTQSQASGADLLAAIRAAVTAARSGRDATRDMVCQRGRFSRFGDRSIGQIDPGAASITLLLESMLKALSTRAS